MKAMLESVIHTPCKIASDEPTDAHAPAPHCCFWEHKSRPHFHSVRYFWAKYEQASQETLIEVLRNKIEKRLRPGSRYASDVSVRHDVLLPPQTSPELWSIEQLLNSLNRTAPVLQALSEIKIEMVHGVSLVERWEVIRAFALESIVRRLHVPAIIMLHTPGICGSKNLPHAHIMIVPRVLDLNGWGHVREELCFDWGFEELEEIWSSSR